MQKEQQRRLKNISKNVIILFLATACFYMAYRLNQFTRHGRASDIKVSYLTRTVIKNHEVVKGVEDTIRILLKNKGLGPDTVTLPGDTVFFRQQLEDVRYTARSERSYLLNELGRLQDTLIQLKSNLMWAKLMIDEGARERNNLLWLSAKTVDKKSLIDSNANVSVVPIRRSSLQSLFSPQKNFLRVFNNYPGGSINGQPYFDYEETNEELNMLLFQARTGYNFNTGAFSVGPGIELKLNRIGINAAELFNTGTGHFTTSLGTRLDLYRVRFK